MSMRHEQITDALDELLPAMVIDGGGARLTQLHDDRIVLELVGACRFCPSVSLSAAALERGLRARVPELGTVEILVRDPSDSSRLILRS
jgi:Fe-S cluster biogenesis protein NfuA